jgi:ribosomal protein S18 acetylase RimI-like enzyme
VDGSEPRTGRGGVEDFLKHHGVKGMKWGVRNNGSGSGSKPSAKIPKGDLVLQEKLKSGETVSIYKKPPPPIARFISKHSESYKNDVAAYAMFGLHGTDGKKVGDAAFVRDSKTSLYLDWIGIKQKERGKGYASSALRGVIKYSQGEGITKLTLEVPTNAPDARHIYESLGFKAGKTVVDKDDPAFGGLTPMSLNVPKVSVKHAEEDDQAFVDAFAEFLSKHFANLDVIKHMTSVEDILSHHGVKGMKWGKKKNPPSADAARSASVKTTAKKQGLHTVSNKDLQEAITRMNLEQNFKRLKVNDQSAATRWISSTLLEVGKREVQTQLAKKVGGTLLKKAATGGAA